VGALAQRARRRNRSGLVDIAEHDTRAALHEGGSRRPADTARRTGEKDRGAVELDRAAHAAEC
jgi:hypothetical protein